MDPSGRLTARDQADGERFVTPGPGETIRAASFDRDWPAWDAARGRATGGPVEKAVAVRRIPPLSPDADRDVFAAVWLHAAYAKAGGTSVVVSGEPVRT